MVVARHVAPVATIVPHHHRTVLAGQEVAVGLPFEPVLIELRIKKNEPLGHSYNRRESEFNFLRR